MNATIKTEASARAELERLALSARNIRRSVEHAHTAADKRALSKQLNEIQSRIDHLKAAFR